MLWNRKSTQSIQNIKVMFKNKHSIGKGKNRKAQLFRTLEIKEKKIEKKIIKNKKGNLCYSPSISQSINIFFLHWNPWFSFLFFLSSVLGFHFFLP